MWERNLQDLIRGLRAHKNDESRFISGAIGEIRKEVRSEDMELKAAAVVKLTYLEMLGYDMSWASFHVVEVMSSSRYHLKSMGYLAATQSFEQDTDVLMLTTNLLKKDLTSGKPLDIAVALNGFSHIVTADLARDLARDLISMLTHSRAAIRKRAVLALYKLFMKHPDSLEYGIHRLKERLEDPDTGVVCATVNVLCELAKQNPKSCLPFAPPLFHILTTSNNNWMLIKIIKLFGLLTPYEPRLIKKLQPPITELISTTPAISLLYECVHTCITGGMLQGTSGQSLARTCITKLATFLEDTDQNLKYIALLALAKIVPSHPHMVAEYESRILASIDDQDVSIRMRALELISAMVNRNNLQSIVQQLLAHLVKPDSSFVASRSAVESLTAVASSSNGGSTIQAAQSPLSSSTAYRTALAQRILMMGGADLYANVDDFEWYISVLIDLAYVARVPVGPLIRDQMIDIVARVDQVRRYALQVSMRVLGDETFANASGKSGDEEGSGCQEVLWAAAWICGEYGSELSDTYKVIPSLLSFNTSRIAPDILAVYVQCIAKVFGTWAVDKANRWEEDSLQEVKNMANSITSGMERLSGHPDFEVQERAANVLQLFNFIRADLSSYRPKPNPVYGNGFADPSTSGFDPVGTSEPWFPKSLYLLQPLFSSYSLNPVATEAQMSVAIPEGLDLDEWINPQAKPTIREPVNYEFIEKKKDRKGKGKDRAGSRANTGKAKKANKSKSTEATMSPEDAADAEARAQAKARRLEMQRDDPYYIIDDKPRSRQNIDVDSIPVVHLDDLPPLNSVGTPRGQSPSSFPSSPRPPPPRVTYVIDRGGEMPPDAAKPVNSTPHTPEQKPTPSATPVRSGTPVIPPSSYPVYEVDEIQSSTPELIKVTRIKKKGTTTGKKKRAKNPVVETPTTPPNI